MLPLGESVEYKSKSDIFSANWRMFNIDATTRQMAIGSTL
jgi:hypothetical protein